MAQNTSNQSRSQPVHRVGYWWSQKKSRKFNDAEFANICRLSGLELVKIDWEQPLEDQGPFAAIVHKLSDHILKADKGDVQSKAICHSLKEYINNHPEVVVLDPLPNVEKLVDRYRQYKLIEDSELQKHGDAFTPAFVELTTKNAKDNLAKMTSAGFTFPCVCKPSVAHGSSLAHEMCIIFNEEGLNDITVPCVAQKFINHNAVLCKIFIISNKYFVIERPSLKNFCTGDQKTIFFHSAEISKPHSASALTELDESELLSPIVWPDKDKMDHMVQVLCEALGLTLFGIDLIVDNNTGSCAIVDMNFFPGYDEVDNFFQILCDVILEKIELRAQGSCEKISKSILLNPPWPNSEVQWNHKSFTFDTLPMCKDEKSMALIPYIPQCFCCPISGACNNSKSKVPVSKELPNDKTPCNEKCLKLHERGLNGAMDSTSFKTQSPDSTQDDSGIETSDSCDEKKKKEPGFRTVRRQHSRIICSPPSL